MPQIIISPDGCKGCELCVHACPQQILAMGKRINKKGYFYAEVAEHTAESLWLGVRTERVLGDRELRLTLAARAREDAARWAIEPTARSLVDYYATLLEHDAAARLAVADAGG